MDWCGLPSILGVGVNEVDCDGGVLTYFLIYSSIIEANAQAHC